MKNIPKKRFPEFANSGEWKEKKLSDICDKPYSGGTPSSTNKEFYGGNIPFIRSAEIDKEQTELFLTDEGLKNSSAKLVKKGNVLIALYGANSGDVAISKIDGAINQAILCLNTKDSNPFLFQYLTFKKDWIVAKYIQGGQGNLSGEIVKSIQLNIPKPNEQQKIADCLSSLDSLISAQSQKVELLKEHKKGLLQNLFPTDGENRPKKRFPEFLDDEEWVEKKLKEILLDYRLGGNYSNTTIQNNYPLIKMGNIARGNIVLDKLEYITEVDEISILDKIKYGDLFLNTRNTLELVGKVAIWKNELPNAYYNSNLMWMKYENNFFMNYRFNSADGIKALRNIATGTTSVSAIYTKDLLNLKLLSPLPKEQQKIADCLSSIDEQICQQTQKLQILKEHKKGLMQQLFPDSEAING